MTILKINVAQQVPTGLYSELIDNSDFSNTTATGTWPTSATGSGYVGYNYQTHAKGTGTDTFTWKLHIPADGNYTVYVRYPSVSGAATNASFTVSHSGGSATVPVDQTQNPATWVSLGKYAFTQAGTGQKVTLAENTGGIVVADAVRVIRDTTGVTNTAHHDFGYTYDPNANLTGIADSSPGTAIASYAMTYDGVNRLTKVEEDNSSLAVVHTTTYGYDAAGNLTSRGHDAATSAYTYDARNLLATQTDKTSATDPSPRLTTFTYTPDGLRKTEVKPNGNNVAYAYFADQLLQTQTETTKAGTLVAQHAYTYNPDGVKASDAAKLMNADTTTAYLTHTLGYSYDPRDWLTQVTADGTATEAYVHDATGNVTSQTISGTKTTFGYDRDRLMSAAVIGGATSYYNYDPLGRLDTVTSSTGTQLESNTYDGFDHIVSHTAGTTATSYTYDPLSRLTSQKVNNGNPTQFAYLGLSSQLITETPASGPSKSYTYTADGERISQASTSGGTTTTGYYTYNDHSDVEAITGAAGTTTAGKTIATYGYTAYGQPVAAQFTGADKNNVNPSPTAQPLSAYRFNAMRWDSTSGQYDMGFRNYAPGLNQFLSRDMYDGALADMSLATDPFTGNRYTFGGGNPISNIELDGHMFPGGGGCNPCNPSPPSVGSQAGTGLPTCPTGAASRFAGPCTVAPLGKEASGGGGLPWSNIWHAAVSGLISIFTRPAANVVSGVYMAGGGIAQGTYHLPGANPAAGLAARVNQIGSYPVPGGNPESLSYKIPYYAAPFLLVGAGGLAKLRELLAPEEATGSLTGAALARSGVNAEGRVSQAIGIPRNIGPGRVTIPGSGPGGFRVPDFNPTLTIPARGTVVEVKDMLRLSASPQLRDDVAFAQGLGVPLEIFTNATLPGSGELFNWIQSGQVIISPIP